MSKVSEYSALSIAELKALDSPIDIFMSFTGGGRRKRLSHRIVTTSEFMGVGDADISLGSTTFGTDYLIELQAILDLAENGPVTIFWDGKYSVSGVLKIRGNTTIIGLSGCGVILRDHSNSYVLQNFNHAKPSDITSVAFDNIIDKNIRIENLIINGNGYNTGPTGSDVFDVANAGSAVNGSAQTKRNQIIDFTGVQNLVIKNVQLLGGRYWATSFSNCLDVLLDNVLSDHGESSDRDLFNYDGIHIKGMIDNFNMQNITIRNAKDDNIALNAHSQLAIYIDYRGFIRNLTLDGLHLDSKAMGFGIYSETSVSRIDNIKFKGIRGSTNSILGRITCGEGATPDGLGDIGTIIIEDVEVDVGNSSVLQFHGGLISVAANIEKLILRNLTRKDYTHAASYISVYNQRSDTSQLLISELIIDGVLQETALGAFGQPFLWVNKSQGAQTATAQINRLIINNFCHVEATSYVSANVVKVDGASSTINSIILSNIDAVRINTVVNNVSGIVNAIQASNVNHNGSAFASFITNGTTARLLLANIQSSILFSGTFTKKEGDGFDFGNTTVAGLPSAAQFKRCFVTNESGGAVPAFSDGTNWRRVTDRAIVT